MKSIVRKLTAALLCAALLLSLPGASASYALGDDLAAGETVLHEGTTLHRGSFYSNTYADLREETYVDYTPNSRVTPLVTFGGATTALTAVPDAAQALEQEGLRVVAGVNGGYYGVSHGVPLGPTMANGELQNAAPENYAVGFRADGSAILGAPELRLQTTVNGGSGPAIFAFNHVRQSSFGIFLYSHTFNAAHTTFTDEPGVDVICSYVGGRLSIGGTLSLRVDEVLPEARNTVVEEGKYVLTANLSAPEGYTAPLLALQPGDELTVTVTAADPAWNEVENMVGALYPLIEDGQVASGLPSGAAPRTAVGQREDGSLVFYTIDGRQSGYSIGATLAQVAERLIELGCVRGLSLDGGGSTTLVAALPDQTAAHVQNRPSEGSVRAVSDQLFLVASGEPSGQPDHLYLAPESVRALPGAAIALTAALVDTNYIPMPAEIALSADGGSIDGGVLTVPDGVDTVTVTARAGELGAEASVAVVASPDRIALTQNGKALTALTLSPNGSAALRAQALTRRGLPVSGGNECFIWETDGDLFTVENGVVTASGRLGSGTLTVRAGETVLSVPVRVTAPPLRTLADFESGVTLPAPAEDSGVTLALERSEGLVRFGRAALRIDYAAAEDLPARAAMDFAVPAGYDRLNLWLCGDGSGAVLMLETDAGDVDAGTLDFTGWQQLSLTLPEGAQRIRALTLAGGSGTVRLDQLVLSYGGTVDTEPPALTASIENGALTGAAFDAVDGTSLALLRVTYDGQTLPHSYDSWSGALRVALPDPDGGAHRVSLTAGDHSGHLARLSLAVDPAPDAAPAFSDVAGHWAASAVGYLKDRGLSNGDGLGRYNPDANITRQEFAVMLARYLAPTEALPDADLPFADADEIAPWAAEGVRAMAALGVVKGSPDDRGALRFRPTAEISRQEAVTMLGRLWEKGYAPAPLAFTDARDIPAWASEYVSLLVSLGVLSGYADGAFHPADPMTRAQVATVLYKMS